jgi:hypothetical protein
MRNDPLFIAWTVQSESPEAATRARDALRVKGDQDAVLVDFVIGAGVTREVPYRVGDFFEEVRIIPSSLEDANTFQVLFHRLPTAGRFWKDVMMFLLDAARKAAGGVSITLAYRGDDYPYPVSTT